MSEKIKFTIRKARRQDMELVFLLSNDPVVRQQSIHPEIITLEKHVEWFTRKIKDPDYIFLVAYDQNKQFIGQVRYEIHKNSAVISISISRNFRGEGLAVPLLKKTAAKVFKMKRGVKGITAYIKPDNIVSAHSFVKAGYVFRRQVLINDTLYHLYTLKRRA
jgi:RimJ/RimL family protein N-acetyltransferase